MTMILTEMVQEKMNIQMLLAYIIIMQKHLEVLQNGLLQIIKLYVLRMRRVAMMLVKLLQAMILLQIIVTMIF